LGDRTIENAGTLIQTVSNNSAAWLDLDGAAVLNSNGLIDLQGITPGGTTATPPAA